MQSYYEKIVVTRGITEVWRYEKLNTKGGGNPEGKETDGADKEANYKLRQKKRRERIRQLANMNFDSKDKFVTLTFRDGVVEDVKCVKECNKFFRLFILRLKYRYPDLKYLAVIEFLDIRKIANHMIMNCSSSIFISNCVLKTGLYIAL